MKSGSEKIVFLAISVGLYLISAGAAYAAFNFIGPGQKTPAIVSQTKDNGKFVVPRRKYAGLPRTEECPLNGTKYSVPERELWEKRRPLGVMVENSKAARPQSGLSFADVVYEAVAEGGITRFMAVYYCQDAETIGPVRSARTYYLDWISEYGSSPLYAHVGGANTPGPADALGQIDRYGWAGYNDLNQFSIGFPYFWRDYERLGVDTATEHTVYTSNIKLWDFAAKKRDLTNVEINDRTGKETAWDATFAKWAFKDDLALDQRPAKFSAEFALSKVQASYSDDYTVTWIYDHDSNSFLRTTGGKEHRDLNTNQQLTAKNIVILFMSMSIADDGYNEENHGSHTLYGNKGTGKAKFIIDGQVTDGTWSKKTRVDQTIFLDSKGQPVKFNRGQTWIEILPIGQSVNIAQ